MQAWTPVVVSEPAHSRTGTAGICQGAPFTPEAASAGRAAELRVMAEAAELKADDARAALAELTIAAQAAERLATDARQRADEAQDQAEGEHTDVAPRVRVKFDVDGEVLEVPVASLTALG